MRALRSTWSSVQGKCLPNLIGLLLLINLHRNIIYINLVSSSVQLCLITKLCKSLSNFVSEFVFLLYGHNLAWLTHCSSLRVRVDIALGL